MRFLNHIANRTFAKIFSYLLNQRLHRHVVRNEGSNADRLLANRCSPAIFWRIRSIRRFRSDLRSGQAESADHRGARALQGAHLRRNADLPIPRRVAADQDGAVRVQEIESDLMTSDDLKASESSRCPPPRTPANLGREADSTGGLRRLSPPPGGGLPNRSIAGSRRRLGAFQELSSIRHLARYPAISGHRRRCGRARNALSGRVFRGNRDDRCVASPAAATGLPARSGAGFEAAWPRGHDRAGHECRCSPILQGIPSGAGRHVGGRVRGGSAPIRR